MRKLTAALLVLLATPIFSSAAFAYTECRPFAHTIIIDGKQQEATGIACPRGDGTWQVMPEQTMLQGGLPNEYYQDEASGYRNQPERRVNDRPVTYQELYGSGGRGNYNAPSYTPKTYRQLYGR